MRRLLAALTAAAVIAGCGSAKAPSQPTVTGRPPTDRLRTLRLVSDISIRCNEIRSHRDRPSAHSSLTRDIDGLIGLYRTPDALNPRQEVRLRMSEASRLLRFRCDAQLAQRLDSALGS